jgi:ribonuclease VapC
MASLSDEGPTTDGGIVVDTSAVVALTLDGPAATAVQRQLEAASSRSMAGATVVELGMVLIGRVGDEGQRRLDRFLDDAEVDVVPFDERLAMLALDGFRRFGKGRHPAALNLGDCFTYALALDRGEPILCTGQDFRRSDVAVVDLGPSA